MARTPQGYWEKRQTELMKRLEKQSEGTIQRLITAYNKSKDNIQKEIQKIDMSVPAYISIDKDVLDRYWARTNWNQGHMSIRTLEMLLKEVFQNQEVIGVDICGECNLQEPLNQLVEDQKINHTTNDILYHFLSRYMI